MFDLLDLAYRIDEIDANVFSYDPDYVDDPDLFLANQKELEEMEETI